MLDKLPARDHVVIATIEVVHRFQSPLCRDFLPARVLPKSGAQRHGSARLSSTAFAMFANA